MRAFSLSVLASEAATVRAIWFQWATGPAPPAQKRALWVWSAVRVALSDFPMAFTSFTSFAYAALESAGGPTGSRKCELLGILHGVTVAQFGNVAGAFAGGVGRHWPGSVPGVYGVTVALPSFARSARMLPATELPSAMPSVFAAPAGMPLRLLPSAVSSVACCAGNTFNSTS